MPNRGPLTTGQAAQHCHVSQATIVNWIRDGKLRAYTTPGGHHRIRRSDLVAFLERHSMPIDSELREPNKRVLLVSSSPVFEVLTDGRTGWNGFELMLVHSDYEASAKLVQYRPHAVVIDMATATDPLRLCRWVNRAARQIALVVTGENDDEEAARSAGADIYLTYEALGTLRGHLSDLLGTSQATVRGNENGQSPEQG